MAGRKENEICCYFIENIFKFHSGVTLLVAGTRVSWSIESTDIWRSCSYKLSLIGRMKASFLLIELFLTHCFAELISSVLNINYCIYDESSYYYYAYIITKHMVYFILLFCDQTSSLLTTLHLYGQSSLALVVDQYSATSLAKDEVVSSMSFLGSSNSNTFPENIVFKNLHCLQNTL